MIITRTISHLQEEDCHGWVLLDRGTSYLSSLIQKATGSPYSHVGIVVKEGNRLDVCEVREFIGGRRQPLRSQVGTNKIDVFKPVDAALEHWDRETTAEMINLMAGTSYGYGSIFRIIMRKLPLLWRFTAISDDEARPTVKEVANVKPICSQAVFLAMAEGGLPPISRKPSYLVTPGDIGHSPLLEPWGRLS